MSWSLALYQPPSALVPCFSDHFTTIEAIRVAVGHLHDRYCDDEILFRFETPETATDAEIDELRCLGLVNGEALARY